MKVGQISRYGEGSHPACLCVYREPQGTKRHVNTELGQYRACQNLFSYDIIKNTIYKCLPFYLESTKRDCHSHLHLATQAYRKKTLQFIRSTSSMLDISNLMDACDVCNVTNTRMINLTCMPILIE